MEAAEETAIGATTIRVPPVRGAGPRPAAAPFWRSHDLPTAAYDSPARTAFAPGMVIFVAMRCACNHINRPGRRFCAKCGSRLGEMCGACGTQNDPGENFCGSCGAALSAGAMSAPGVAASQPLPSGGMAVRDAERRHLTVMFCDLVGSTELAGRMDPEEWRHVVHGYQQSATEVVARFGGHVAKYLGDGLLVYFGWPRAHGDDAERAVHAGLGIVEVVPAYDARLAVRIGIHTGLAVVGEREVDGSIEAVGDSLNIAARVEALATPNTVLVTDATHRLIAGLFIVQACGPQALKGVTNLVALYRVVRPSGMRRLAAAVAARGFTPLIGREQERLLLAERFERARNGHGQVVTIVGEPGIGKSRLARVLGEDISGAPHTWIETSGASYFANTPFYAVTELLRQPFVWGEDDGPEARIAALERALEAAGLAVTEALPLIAPLMDLPVPKDYAPALEAPEVTHRQLLATLAAWVFGLARLQPLVILLEDLHWVDPSTLGLQQLLVEGAATAPLLLLCTTRPEFKAPWALRDHHTQIVLSRLDRQHTRELVLEVAARAVLPAEVVETVLARADGVPLFVEELTRAIVEGGAQETREIPATLHDSLVARLDRLGYAAKETAQVGAVLGREFSYELLQAVHPRPAAELEMELGNLVDSDLLYVRGVPPDATYHFKHALVQDAAYGSLLKSRRRVLHERVAKELVTQFADVAESRPELVAHHYTEAAQAELALAAWQRAGEHALQQGAFGEAASHLSRGLEVLRVLPESRERDEREFHLQRQLGQALVITKGYSSPEATGANARARALEENIQDPGQSSLILVSLSIAALSSEGPTAARPLADQALAAAERGRSHLGLVWSHLAQGSTRYHEADFVGAREHLARAIALCDKEAVAPVPFDPRIGALGFAAATAWHLGLVEEARRHVRDGVERAQRSGRPADRAWAERFAATLSQFMREPGEARRHAERAIAACAEESNLVEEGISTALLGWAMAAEGDLPQGIAKIREGIERLLATGMRLLVMQHLNLLADAQSRAGDVAVALASLAEGECAVPGEEVSRAETLRFRAELLARQGADPATIEATLLEALGTARRQGAKSYELRTATSYARFLRERGRAAEARDLLAPIYAWFTESFDARDLIDAKVLLEELDG
jgi:class 3 adenylate cyclase